MRWKVYLWLMVVLFVVALGLEVAEPADAPLIDAIDYLSWGFSLIGVFGYAYSRAIVNRRVWRVWLPIVIVWDIAVLARQFTSADAGLELAMFIVFTLVGIAVIFPEYVAIYRYGYRSDHLWASRI